MSGKYVVFVVCAGLAAYLTTLDLWDVVQRRRAVRVAREQVGLVPVRRRSGVLSGRTRTFLVWGLLVGATSSLVIGPAGVVAGVVPSIVIGQLDRRRRAKRSEAISSELGPALRLVVGNLRIGRNVGAAIGDTAGAVGEPLRSILEQIVTETRLGRPLAGSFAAVADREDNRHLATVASALALHSTHGGSLIEILETVAETIEEEDRLRRDIASLTADGRLSATVLLVLPAVAAGFISLVSPDYLSPLVSTAAGRTMLTVAALLSVVGWRWLRNLAQPAVTA